MGKKRDYGIVGDDSMESSSHSKKHKKHKHKKHKRHREPASGGQSSDTGQSELLEATDSSGKPQLKLKIKIGGQTLRTKSFDKISVTASSDDPSEEEEEEEEEEEDILDDDVSSDTWRGATPSPASQASIRSVSKLSKEEAEEEAWLDALEAGKLDEYGEIPKPKDESLLTARQKSRLKRMAADEEESAQISLFGAQGKVPEMTEEMIEKKQQKAQRRRVQERRKVEENKKQTIEKLLKKQDAKLKDAKAKQKRSLGVPHVRYLNSTGGISLSYPAGHEFPITKTVTPPVKPIVSCAVTGCLNAKKYSCSKTGVPLCSLACYKKNQTLICAT